MVLVSVITINRNDSNGLKKTIDSIINQTYKEFEYIVIDGNSNDGSKEVIKMREAKITYWISESDTGIYNAMNKGITKANGKYLLFLNSGDYFTDNTVLQNVVKQLNDEDIVYGDMIIDRNGILEKASSDSPLLFEEMIRGTLWHPVSFIKKELFNKYGLYNEAYKIISDYDFFLKTIYVYKASTKHIPVYVSVFNTDGIGSSTKHHALQQKERYLSQSAYFHPEIIKSALNYTEMKRSKPQIILNWLKTKPVLFKVSKLIYSFAKNIV